MKAQLIFGNGTAHQQSTATERDEKQFSLAANAQKFNGEGLKKEADQNVRCKLQSHRYKLLN